MLKIFENACLYDIQSSEYIKVLHNEAVKADLLILLKIEIELQPELIEMLDKMVAALNIDRSKIEYLVFNNVITLNELVNSYEAPNVLVFGATPSDLSLNMELRTYENYCFYSFKLLLVNNILDIYGNKDLKSKLWNVLKEMFN
jgi:hypothetical protein